MNQVLHLQVNQQFYIASIISVASSCLKTWDDCGNDLEMLLTCYLPKEWAQLLSTQRVVSTIAMLKLMVCNETMVVAVVEKTVSASTKIAKDDQ